MLAVFKELATHQFEAAYCTLGLCMDRCPPSSWNARVANYLFCQVAFHTLFFADYYLGENEEAFRRQSFHRDHAAFFGDYEEFADRAPQSLYEKADLKTYLDFCRRKAREAIAVETAESLQAQAGFARRTFSRAELHIYNIRHIQHHAAQLGLRLRLDANIDIPWVGSGWREFAPAPEQGT
jgi:hypothetical protein